MSSHTANELRNASCKPCEGGVEKMEPAEAESQIAQLTGWELENGATAIAKSWTKKNFVDGLAFLNQIGEIAEAEQHHPNMHLVDYKKIKVELTTHAIGGLSENDFILAAKIDGIDG